MKVKLLHHHSIQLFNIWDLRRSGRIDEARDLYRTLCVELDVSGFYDAEIYAKSPKILEA